MQYLKVHNERHSWHLWNVHSLSCNKYNSLRILEKIKFTNQLIEGICDSEVSDSEVCDTEVAGLVVLYTKPNLRLQQQQCSLNFIRQ